MTTLTLREWSSTAAVPLARGQVDGLRTVFKATVQPASGRDGCYDVSTAGTVGAAQFGDLSVVVVPKLPITRLLFLLGYAADPSFGPNDAELDTRPELVGGVIRLFTMLAERAMRGGVLRGYRTIDAELPTVRGRIDLAEQLRRRPGMQLPLSVRFQEHDENIVENQLLLAATTMLQRVATHDRTARRLLHRIRELLQNVDSVHYPPAGVPIVTWTRLNQHLRPAVELARLLVQMQSPEVAAGTTRTPGLTIDMAVLFEAFVRTAMREALGVDDHRFPTGKQCPLLWLDEHHHIRLEPDLSYWTGATCTFIGDVKYKRDTGPGHNDDLYQLLAYATAARLPEATLIYALGPSTPRTHTVPGPSVRLRIEHLDLSVPPTALLSQLARIARRVPAGPPGTAPMSLAAR